MCLFFTLLFLGPALRPPPVLDRAGPLAGSSRSTVPWCRCSASSSRPGRPSPGSCARPAASRASTSSSSGWPCSPTCSRSSAAAGATAAAADRGRPMTDARRAGRGQPAVARRRAAARGRRRRCSSLTVVGRLFGDTLVGFASDLLRGFDALPDWLVRGVRRRRPSHRARGAGRRASSSRPCAPGWRMVLTVALAVAVAVVARGAARRHPRHRRGARPPSTLARRPRTADRRRASRRPAASRPWPRR